MEKAARVPAKATLAIRGSVRVESTPRPMTGTELPRKQAM